MEISLKNNQKHTGKIYNVLVEKAVKNDLYTGRTFFQALEVNGITYIHSEKSIKNGQFVKARITNTSEYDITGETI